MTVSAASSPVVLLTPAVDPAKAVASTTSTASADGGGDGFQLLLAQAAEGVRAATGIELLTPNTVATAPPVAVPVPAEDGNTLPLLTDLLPPAPCAAVVADGEAPIKADGDNLAEKEPQKSDEQTDDDSGLVLLAPMTPLLPIAPPPAPVANVGVPTAAATGTESTSVAGPGPASVSATTPATATAPPAVAGVELATPMLKKEAPISGETGTAGANANNVSVATTQQAPDAAALLNSSGDNAKQQNAPAESDFDAMLKQFDTAPPTSSTGSVDSGRAVHQAARPYVNTAPTTATVSIPVAAEGWSDAVNDKVMWFSANKINSAEIHLNPPDLGPIQVRISTQQDQATVYFTSQHASVREALDQALPRLREMMGGQGIQLADAGVGSQNSSRQQEYQGNPDGRPRSTPDGFFRDIGDSAEPIGISSVSAARISRSGIDAYA